ncbi:hypothetical protein [Bdellovibrio bacteriovorus]|uniref:hypothetical protein n=1 Tax=Bdellovibrio bacteriovorus TaxID=959 RepID=UPI0035A62F61
MITIPFKDKSNLSECEVVVSSVFRDFEQINRWSMLIYRKDHGEQSSAFIDFHSDGTFIAYSIVDSISGKVFYKDPNTFSESFIEFTKVCISTALDLMKKPMNSFSRYAYQEHPYQVVREFLSEEGSIVLKKHRNNFVLHVREADSLCWVVHSNGYQDQAEAEKVFVCLKERALNGEKLIGSC